MAGERTPILPSSLPTPTTGVSPRRRAACLVGGVVSIVVLFVVALHVSSHLTPSSSSKATSAGAPPPPQPFMRTVTFPADANGNRNLLPYCEEKYYTQQLNHFEPVGISGTYQQRVFLCGANQFFNRTNGTIFFYNGNEGDVMLFLNNTGLMWENAEEFNALLVFAEHRYFGKSIPSFGQENVLNHMQFLSSTQALADFAVVIQNIKQQLDADVPVIGFGGSYGGMLGTWFRLKYPHLMDGVIAASAPVLISAHDPESPLDSESFLRVTSFDMSAAAGSSPSCATNARKAIALILRLGGTREGREILATQLRVCGHVQHADDGDAQTLIDAIAGELSGLAQSNYPYPSSYSTDGVVNLPAYPMHVACEHLARDFEDDDDIALLASIRDAVGVAVNASGDKTCFFPSSSASPALSNTTRTLADVGNLWSYIQCAEIYLPSSSDGIRDIFPPQQENEDAQDAGCMALWGIHMRPNLALTEYGGLKALRTTSNIVFSNGNFDPWSGLGVLHNLSDSVVALPIDGGAHHADLFFAHPLDPPSFTEARRVEKSHIHKWVHEFYERKEKRRTSSTND